MVIRSMVPVILSGGAGSRLWPLSRELRPKQLIALTDEHTLLQGTARRLASLDAARPPIVVCNEAHRFMVAEQLEAVGVTPTAILLEPAARNTAPAIAAAAFEAIARSDGGDDPVLLVLPSDHVVRDEARFAGAVRQAVTEAAKGRIALLGVVPAWAETGYGYIMAGEAVGEGSEARLVERFAEKPNAEDAASWLQAGNCYWNSGMFAFTAHRYLRELGIHAGSIRLAVEKSHECALPDLGFLRLDAECFAASPAVSVDYAVMERVSDAVVVPLDAGWSDVGSWSSLSELSTEDEAGNVVHGNAILEGARNSYVRSDKRLVAAVGVDNLVIVDTPDALLVAEKKASQDVKRVVERLEGGNREEHRTHRKVYRPWGNYDSVHGGDGFKIKHIVVQPGQRLSLQAHRHRAEHWVVVRGEARVTRDGETFTLLANQSTFIPKGVKHRLENPGTSPLEIIEVQTGSYLEEDDIERFEDAYGRADPRPPRSASNSPRRSG